VVSPAKKSPASVMKQSPASNKGKGGGGGSRRSSGGGSQVDKSAPTAGDRSTQLQQKKQQHVAPIPWAYANVPSSRKES
jgi:hypothetical protein